MLVLCSANKVCSREKPGLPEDISNNSLDKHIVHLSKKKICNKTEAELDIRCLLRAACCCYARAHMFQ